jgi:DMSO reductase family type II enzyme heme b subunit
MGAENLPVVGALWRADREDLYRIDAEGLGSVRREAAPEGWRATSKYERGFWTVVFELDAWPSLRKQKMIALAVWRGDAQDRGGLKSVSQGWINVEV